MTKFFARQTFRFEGFVRGFGLQPRFAQPLDDPQVLRVGEVVDDGIGDLAAHLSASINSSRVACITASNVRKCAARYLAVVSPDESDAQGEQYPLKRNLDRAPDAPDDVLGRFFRPTGADRRAVRPAGRTGRRCRAAVRFRRAVRRSLRPSLDVHRLAADEVMMRPSI